MKIKNTKDYILLSKELGESDSDFTLAFETGIITLVVGKNTKNIKGIKIWKTANAKNILDNL